MFTWFNNICQSCATERDMVICNHNIKKPAIGIQDFGELESNDLNAVLNHVANVGPLGVRMGGAKFLHVRLKH